MSEQSNGVVMTPIDGHDEGIELLQQLTEVAQPEAVFSDPVEAGEYTIITASEVSVVLGYGYGMGGGSAEAEDDDDDGAASGWGGGGGGGGYAASRAVAVISIGPDGVHVEPIVDRTKLAMTVVTVLLSLIMGRRRRR